MQDGTIKLTKTDFIQYLACSKSLWLKKREPQSFPQGNFSLFLEKIVREGYQVEEYVQRYFEARGRSVSFQRVFETDERLFARADVVETTTSGQTFLYEVKSSTSVKIDSTDNHIKDACFQKICAERAGQKIDRVFIVHLNGNYIRNGSIDPDELLVFVDVTERVEQLYSETSEEVDQALELLKVDRIDRNGCSCLYKSRANHCDAFSVFNPGLPKYSIYSLPRLGDRQRADWVGSGVFDLIELPAGAQLTEIQRLIVQAAKSGEPQINRGAINTFLSRFSFPLYFFDYETYASAIPVVNGTRPYQQVPVQYSLHVLQKDGFLSHFEYLAREACLPGELVGRMKRDIGPEGSIVSWHATFERSRNRELAEMFPDSADFLNDLNARMVDLEDIFKTNFVDIRFDGSTSIKKVLPVLCPDLDYGDLEVQDGTSAMESWERMINAEPEESEEIAEALLKYCERDTFAMVEIYRFLITI